MIIIGKLKLNFLKFICNKEKVNKNPKRVLLILNDAYFRNKKDFEKNKKKVIEYDFSNYAKDNFNSMEFDNGLLFVYTKKQIELYKKIAKKFKNINFILRPHPSDFENIKKFKKLFFENKNIKIEKSFDVNFWIQKCDKIISGPGSVNIESLYLNRQVFIF